MEKDVSCIWKQKESHGKVTFMSYKIDIKIMIVSRDKEGHYIMIKGLIQEDDITIVNIYGTPYEHLNR